MNNLCDRAFNDYSLVQAFYSNVDQYDQIGSQTKEKEHAAIRVAKKYKSKEFFSLAR